MRDKSKSMTDKPDLSHTPKKPIGPTLPEKPIEKPADKSFGTIKPVEKK